MRLRRARAADLSAFADITCVCNIDDALSRYVTKDIFDHWSSYRYRTFRWLRGVMQSPGAVGLVVEMEDGDRPTVSNERTWKPGTVIGTAIWTREGKSKQAKRWKGANDTWGLAIERFFNNVEGKYYDWMPRVNPAWDLQHWNDVSPLIKDAWDPNIFAEAWELNVCNVDVDWHRQGVGSMLVKWGLEQAEKERVAAIVGASPKGVGAYEKNGFKPFKRENFEQFFEPGGRGIWRMVWEPPGRAGNWYARAVEAEQDKQEEKVREKTSKDKNGR